MTKKQTEEQEQKDLLDDVFPPNEELAEPATLPAAKPKNIAGDKSLVDAQQVQGVPQSAVRAQLYNDWRSVSDADRMKYVLAICKSLDIPTPMNPFRFIDMKGKTVLYAPTEATQLIAKRNKISTQITNKYLQKDDNIYVVEARATAQDGRYTDNIGCVYMGGLTGDARANAIMKAVSKAHRRAIFSMTGLSVADEDDLRAMEKGSVSEAWKPQILSNNAEMAHQRKLAEPADDEEDREARRELFVRMSGYDAGFQEAREMLQQELGKRIEKFTAEDCEEARALIEGAESVVKEARQTTK